VAPTVLDPLTVTGGPDPGWLLRAGWLLGAGGWTSASTSTRSVPRFFSWATISRRRGPTWPYTANAEPSGSKLAGPVTTVIPRVGENHRTPATVVGLAVAEAEPVRVRGLPDPEALPDADGVAVLVAVEVA
jgi:hypothetical protein